MRERLNEVVTDPVSGLRYRVRPGDGQGPCLVLLHGVGGNEEDARGAREVLTDLGVPLQYREFDAGHTLTPAMVADFNAWLQSQLN